MVSLPIPGSLPARTAQSCAHTRCRSRNLRPTSSSGVSASSGSCPGVWWASELCRNSSSHLNVLVTSSAVLQLSRSTEPDHLPVPNFGYIEYQRPVGFGNTTDWRRLWSGACNTASAFVLSTPIPAHRQRATGTRINSGAAPNGRDSPRGPAERLRTTSPLYRQLRVRACLSAGEAVCLTRRPFLPHRQLRASGVYTYASGRPFTVSAGGARANALDAFGAVAATPNLIGTPHIVGNVDCWFFASNDKIARDPMSRSCSRPDRRVSAPTQGLWARLGRKHAARGRIRTCSTSR